MDSECIVYVVDDDPSVRKSLTWLLESASYQTHSFGSAEEFMSSYDPTADANSSQDGQLPVLTRVSVSRACAPRLKPFVPELVTC